MVSALTRPCEVQINAAAMNGRSYQLHVFVLHVDNLSWSPPLDPAKWDQSTHYGGMACIFGGKGPGCATCAVRNPYNVSVDITKTLRTLGLSRHSAALRVVVIDDAGEVSA
jgi:hypothetical protein